MNRAMQIRRSADIFVQSDTATYIWKQLVEHRAVVQEVAGSNLGRTNTQGLFITEENVLPL